MSSRSAGPDRGVRQGDAFRLCLDLNVLCSAALAMSRGRTTTAVAKLFDLAQHGHSGFGPTQLVVSWGMLNRLRHVLAVKLRHGLARSDRFIATIAQIAALGPRSSPPLLVLGGTGLLPLRDVEDAHVLEVAVAGRAHVLATFNFADFVNYRTEVVKRGRIAIHRTADHEVIIAHPAEVLPWVQTGRIDLG